MRHGGQILVQALRANGVTRVFSVPGESFLAALDGLVDSGHPQHRLPPRRRRGHDGRGHRQADRQARRGLRHPRTGGHERQRRRACRPPGQHPHDPVRGPDSRAATRTARPSRKSITAPCSRLWRMGGPDRRDRPHRRIRGPRLSRGDVGPTRSRGPGPARGHAVRPGRHSRPGPRPGPAVPRCAAIVAGRGRRPGDGTASAGRRRRQPVVAGRGRGPGPLCRGVGSAGRCALPPPGPHGQPPAPLRGRPGRRHEPRAGRGAARGGRDPVAWLSPGGHADRGYSAMDPVRPMPA